LIVVPVIRQLAETERSPIAAIKKYDQATARD